MYALVINDAAVQLFDEKPVMHPDMQLVDVSDVAGIAEGWFQTNGKWSAPPPPPPPPPIIPRTISRRQFFQQLAAQSIISKPEALAAVRTGAIPAALQALVDALPSDDAKFDAEMLISGATDFDLDNALTEQMAQAYGWSTSQLDTFWSAAAAL